MIEGKHGWVLICSLINESGMQDEGMDIYFKLFSKYPDISLEERKELEEWFTRNGHEGLWKQISDPERILHDMKGISALDQKKEEYWNYLFEQKMGMEVLKSGPKIRELYWVRYIAAASIVLVLFISGYMWFKNSRIPPQAQLPKEEKPAPIVPGSFKARLTLADGSVVILDSAALGKLATQGQTGIENKKGQLVYDRMKGEGSQKVLYNTLTTGRGESYSVVLADGTKVWLNAASSIHYPLSFPGSHRTVEVKGEAYFEVAKNPKQPFIVKVNGMEVRVLGTVFNVKAYVDEKTITTTLLEGKVLLTKGKNIEVLRPGQQAELLPSGSIEVNDDADIERAVGWQKGLFVFKEDNVRTLMNQLSRWYDVNVVYKGTINDRFTGIINRNLPVSVVLEMLQKSTVHFQIEGRTITVTQ